MTSMNTNDFTTIDAGNGAPVAGTVVQEHKMSLISQELARVRILDLERELQSDVRAAALVRAARRSRRDAHQRAARLRRILLAR
jgi:hypothetical protein